MYKLPKFLCPNLKTELIRLGKSNDGGYSLSEKSLKEVKIIFSFGLDDDWSFEADLKKVTEAKIICFDNSVNNNFWIKRFLKDIVNFNFKSNIYKQFQRFFTFFKYKRFFMQKNIYHIKKHLISRDIIFPNQIEKDFTNLKNILDNWGSDSFFIKMDIEGNEYRVLDDIIENQENMIGLVIEFHNCDLMSDKIRNFIEKIDLDLVHIHVNNFCSATKDNFPTVFELTFSAKQYNSKRGINEFNFPDKKIDQPNNRDEIDQKILFY